MASTRRVTSVFHAWIPCTWGHNIMHHAFASGGHPQVNSLCMKACSGERRIQKSFLPNLRASPPTASDPRHAESREQRPPAVGNAADTFEFRSKFPAFKLLVRATATINNRDANQMRSGLLAAGNRQKSPPQPSLLQVDQLGDLGALDDDRMTPTERNKKNGCHHRPNFLVLSPPTRLGGYLRMLQPP